MKRKQPTVRLTLLGLVIAMTLPAILLACVSDVPSATPASGVAKILLANTSPETDREALVALYNATEGENWANNENWLSDVPLDE